MRPDVNVVSQYGGESSFGTIASCGTRLSSMGFDMGDEASETYYRAAGSRYPTAGVKHRGWSGGVLGGLLDFNHVQIPLALLAGHGTITSPAAGVYSWPISPAIIGADSPKSATVQWGDSQAAQKVAGVQATGLTITYGENSLEIEAPVLGRAIDNASSLDTVTRTLAEAPMSVADLDWFIDSAYGSVGTTQWARVKSGTFTIPDMVGPTFNQNTSQKSIAELVALAVEGAELTIVAEFDPQSRALYDALNVDALPFRYIQSKVTGDGLGGGNNQLFKTNYPVKVIPSRTKPLRGIAGGIYGYTFAFRVMSDGTRSWEATVVNSIATF